MASFSISPSPSPQGGSTSDPLGAHQLQQKRRRFRRVSSIASARSMVQAEMLPMDLAQLIADFVGPDKPLIFEFRDGYLSQTLPNLSGFARQIDYHTAPWLPPEEGPNIEWACIRFVKDPDDADRYHAMCYARECSLAAPGGMYPHTPNILHTPQQTPRNCYVMFYDEKKKAWTYTGRGVTILFPADSRLFFPHSGTPYEYTQVSRMIYGKLVHGVDFTWSACVKQYRKEIKQRTLRHRADSVLLDAANEQRRTTINVLMAAFRDLVLGRTDA